MPGHLLQHSSSPVNFDPPAEDLPVDPNEQARRMAAIEALGVIVKRFGVATVRFWLEDPLDSRIAGFVAEFGADRVGRWLRYFNYVEQGR